MADRSDPCRADRLFRAAVWAFAGIPRPSREDRERLDSLGLALYPAVGLDAKRSAADALGMLALPPERLVRRLADEPVDVCGPLLVCSPWWSDTDLIDLVGRHGRAHAQAISARPGLNPAIAELIAALDTADASPIEGSGAERMRRQLRAMMRPANEASAALALRSPRRQPVAPEDPASRFRSLRSAALSGHPRNFVAALSLALEIGEKEAEKLFVPRDYTALMAALRSLDLGVEQSFLLVAAAYPSAFADAGAIRIFVRRFRMVHIEDATLLVRSLKGASAALRERRPAGAGPAMLRAS